MAARLIGIEDAAETKKKENSQEKPKERFKKTLKRDHEGRFEIALPFANGYPTIKSNRGLAQQRLFSITKKFKQLQFDRYLMLLRRKKIRLHSIVIEEIVEIEEIELIVWSYLVA